MFAVWQKSMRRYFHVVQRWWAGRLSSGLPTAMRNVIPVLLQILHFIDDEQDGFAISSIRNQIFGDVPKNAPNRLNTHSYRKDAPLFFREIHCIPNHLLQLIFKLRPPLHQLPDGRVVRPIKINNWIVPFPNQLIFCHSLS